LLRKCSFITAPASSFNHVPTGTGEEEEQEEDETFDSIARRDRSQWWETHQWMD